MSIYSKLFLRNTTSPYGDVTRNSVLSFNDLDQNFIFLKERDISGVNYSSDTLTIETLGGNSFTTTISGGTSQNIFTTGGTYTPSAGTITYTNNTGGTFNVTGITTDVSPTTLIVSNSGDNDTAQKGSLTNQYSTVVYAANQAVSGDTIYVMAGNYSITDDDWADFGGQTGTTLFRDGVTWYFEAGSNVYNDVDITNKNNVFKAISNDITCWVYGRGNFINRQAYNNANPIVINIPGSYSGVSFHFECQDINHGSHYNPIEVFGFKKVDITIHGKLSWGFGDLMYVSGSKANGVEYINMTFNEIEGKLGADAPWLGRTIALFGDGYESNVKFNRMITESIGTFEPSSIYCRADDCVINVDGRYVLNTRTDGASTLSSLVGVRFTHNSKINIHVDNCIATSLRTNKSLIMLHNNDSEETAEPNTIRISGRYEALQGRVISSEEGGNVYNSDTYILDGEFISNTQEVALLSDNNTDIEISGELRCNYTGSTGYGIRSTVSNSNILLRDLEIVTQGADAINSTVATEIDIKGTLTTNTDVNSNVTLRGLHNLNNIAQPDDLTVRGREILSQTVGSINTTGSTLDWSLSNNFDYTLTTGTTFTFTGDTDGQTIVMGLTQDGTGGHTVTWPAGVKWAAGGTEPTMTSTSGSTDVYTLIKINGTVYGSYIQDFQ